jgi:hypothetical protein
MISIHHNHVTTRLQTCRHIFLLLKFANFQRTKDLEAGCISTWIGSKWRKKLRYNCNRLNMCGIYNSNTYFSNTSSVWRWFSFMLEWTNGKVVRNEACNKWIHAEIWYWLWCNIPYWYEWHNFPIYMHNIIGRRIELDVVITYSLFHLVWMSLILNTISNHNI